MEYANHLENCFANLPLRRSGQFSQWKVAVGENLDVEETFTCTPEYRIYCQLLSTSILCH